MAAHLQSDERSLARLGYRQELNRSLGWPDLIIYGLIFMVVIAPFGIFGGVFQASGGMVALAYAIGVVVMMLTASSYAVMARAYPTAGSVYTYAGRAIHPSVGFLTGWAILLDYVLIPALLSVIAAVSMTSFLPAVPAWAWIIVFVFVNAVLNVYGIKTTKKLNRIFLVGSLLVLAIYLVVAVAALVSGKGRGFSWDPFFNADTFSVGVALAGVSVAALSFLGFDALAMLTEETKGGARQVGRAMYTALGLTGALFIAQTFVASLLVQDPATLVADGDPGGTAFYDTARVAGGEWLATLSAVATALAWGIANNMVAQTTTSRLLYAMARDRQLPAVLGRVSAKRSVPVNAVLLTAAVSLCLGLYMAARDDGITLLASLVNFGALLAFTVLAIARIFWWARNGRPGNPAAHVGVPVLTIAVLLAIIVNTNALAQNVGLTWLGLGTVILIVLHATGRRPRLSGLDTRTPTDDLTEAGHRG